MERGAQVLVKVMLAALLFGAIVLAFHADYRAALLDLWRGQREESPIWKSNAAYYTVIGITPEASDVHAK